MRHHTDGAAAGLGRPPSGCTKSADFYEASIMQMKQRCLMKRLVMFFVIIVLALLPSVMPIHAEDTYLKDSMDQQKQQKDECLLMVRRCGNSAISIQDRIERLKDEIAKGRAVYTLEELNNLQQKLDEVSRTLNFLLEK